MSLVGEVVGFIKSLHLDEKLSPRKNPEITWAYIFFFVFISYLMTLTNHINKKEYVGGIDIFDSTLASSILNPSAKIELIATGLSWTEGPVWMQDDTGGHLLFSDTNLNNIYKWEEGKGMFTIGKTLFISNSGCRLNATHCELAGEGGSNGLLRRHDDSQDLIACVHGDRGIALFRENGTRAMIVTHYKNNLLNSPNDLVFSPEGHLYFTDPIYGLIAKNNPRQLVNRQLDHSGVYMVKADYLKLAMELGEPTAYVRLVEGRLSRPNGLAFSPDYSKLYVANSDPKKPYIYAFEVADDGGLKAGKVFFNATDLFQECERNKELYGKVIQTADGVKVDINGNVYFAGPGGILIVSPEGKLVARIRLHDQASNLAFGTDMRLYITGRGYVARVPVKAKPLRIIRKSK